MGTEGLGTGGFGDILYSLCQQKKLINNIGQIKTSPENVRNCAMAIKVSAVLFLRRTFDLIVTFIRPDPNVADRSIIPYPDS